MEEDILAVKNYIISHEVHEIYEKFLTGNDVWYFKNYLKKEDYSNVYDEFKKYIANNFKVSFQEVAIIGSAKTGFSLSPDKKEKLQKFGTASDCTSDIDIVLISNRYFNKFWNMYLERKQKHYIKDYNYVTNCIFQKFITFKGFDAYEDEEYANWKKQTGEYQKILEAEFDILHPAHYRIFDSWSAAESYYKNSIDKLKIKLQEETNEYTI